LRKFFRWLVGVPIALVVISFAVANRRWVTLSLDPFSQEAPSFALDMPLWLLLFIGIFIGMLVGWAASWLAQGKWRKAARDSKTEVAVLQQELSELRKTEAPRQDISTYPGSFL
jgi:uncharacterized integral membrane protein